MKNFNLISWTNLLAQGPKSTFNIIDSVRGISSELFIDSGVFSLLNRDKVEKHYKELTIENYIAFARELESKKWHNVRYIHFDYLDDRDPDYIKKSNKNFDIMKAEGLSPIPVFRAHDQFKQLNWWLEKGEPVICIAGFVGKEKKIKENYIFTLRKHYGNLCKRFHLLGYGHFEGLKYIRPYSSDCTSWSDPTMAYYAKQRIIKKKNWQDRVALIKQDIPKKVWDGCESAIMDNSFFISKKTGDIKLQYITIIKVLRQLIERKELQRLEIRPFIVTGKPPMTIAKVNKTLTDFGNTISQDDCDSIRKAIGYYL